MQHDAHRPRIRLTRAQVREIDRRSTAVYHIPGIVLMENAARAVTEAALHMLRDAKAPRVAIVCGGGNNGGDGLAIARHLHNRDIQIDLLLAVDSVTYRGDALLNWRTAAAMSLRSTAVHDGHTAPPAGPFDLVIDALFGTGLQSPPRDARWIEWMNAQSAPVLAVDLPSGLDCDTGEPLGPACVHATRTVTFVAEKAGFANPRVRQYLGDVTVGDIGCPRELIDAVATELADGSSP
jgi:NAD(P)H-hydrate epimerase